MNDPIIQLDQVSFRYHPDEKIILDHLSLDIPTGSITALLGPNGTGKTTLLYILLGWLKPQSGRVLLAGKPLSDYSRRDMGHWMGLVPQSEHTQFEYSLMEYVLLGRSPYLKPLEMPTEADVRIATEALDQVGLLSMKNRSVVSLSGGEYQLVLIARAMTQQPRLLLLDEPTNHLDLGNKGRLLDLFRKLNRQGVTIIFTTHEPEVASVIASHLVMLKSGSVLHSGPLDGGLNAELLSELYGWNVTVTEVAGRKIVLWG
jgi:iron complex transport system ATP-binding protein